MARNTITQNAPEQHPMLVLPRNRKVGEDQRDDKDVVHGQRLLDHETGHVFHAALCAQVPPDPRTKHQRRTDVAPREQQAFFDANFPVVLVQHAQVKGEQRNNDTEESQLYPDGFANKICAQ